MDMQDRATRGFISGLIGAFIQMIFVLTMFSLGLSSLRFMDFAGVMTFNHRPTNFLEMIFAEATVFIFCGFLAVVFVYLLKALSTKNLILKGGVYGIGTWFFIFACVTLFRIDGLYPTNFPSTVVHMIGGFIYGAAMSYSFARLTKMAKLTDQEADTSPIPQPAMKPLFQDTNQEDKS